MKWDVLLIGGGLASLTAGIKCAAAGLETALVSAGASALHFSSGCLDLLGFWPGRRAVEDPALALEDLTGQRPGHPYARTGVQEALDALAYVKRQAGLAGQEYFGEQGRNHSRLTGLGALKPTYLSPATVMNAGLKDALAAGEPMAILGLSGFRDFSAALMAMGLAGSLEGTRVTHAEISLGVAEKGLNPNEFRSIDLARLFERDDVQERAARLIRQAAPKAGVVGLPAVLGLGGAAQVHARLEELTGKLIFETPSLPPSMPGLRLEEALKTRFAALGGVFIHGDRVISGEIRSGRLTHVHTQNSGAQHLTAKSFILATGSFFSLGLTSEFETMKEPILGLEVEYAPGRGNWRAGSFFAPGSHPFLGFGLKTDEFLRPFSADGLVVENLVAAGALLAGYNPVAEASGGGVAVASGLMAARQVIELQRASGR